VCTNVNVMIIINGEVQIDKGASSKIVRGRGGRRWSEVEENKS
jgi:hypothetical protein